MQEIIKLLDSVVQQTAFETGNLGTFSMQELHKTYHTDKLHGGLSKTLITTKVPEGLLAKLTQKLSLLLNKYIEPESNCIGNGLAHLIGGLPHPTIAEFAQILVRAAATLESEKVVHLLFGWINGKPLHYRACGFLFGVTANQTLAIDKEMDITPGSSADLPVTIKEERGIGGVLLSINCKVKPALYRPSNTKKPRSSTQCTWDPWNKVKSMEHSLNTLCEALSLTCNHYVLPKFSWKVCEELEDFRTIPASYGTSINDVPNLLPPTCLSQEHLEQARYIHLKRYVGGETNPRLDTAISRWLKSKRFMEPLSNKLIELRIALEALYLGNEYGENKFRLATYAAWHLGSNFEERRKYHEMFLKAYKSASIAVHAGTIKKAPETTTIQNLCRKAILKILKEGQKQDWTEMILGAGVD